MMMTVGKFRELQDFVQQKRKCSHCGKKRSRMILERFGCQHRLHFICDSCFLKTTWVNSEDWRSKKSGSIRKFIESMSVSGISYWKYKRYLEINILLLYIQVMHYIIIFILIFITYCLITGRLNTIISTMWTKNLGEL